MTAEPNRRPVILQVVTHLDLGGAEEVVLALTEQLYAQTPRRYDVEFFAVNGLKPTPVGEAMKRRLDRLGVPVHRGSDLELKRGGFIQAALRLATLTRKLRPDIVHLHTEIPELTHALSRGFLKNRAHPVGRAPSLTRTLHNTSFWGPWQRMGSQVERGLVDVPLAACSEAALLGLQDFRIRSNLNALGAGQGQVILNGVAPAQASRQNAPGGPVRVLFAGRLELQKGADLLPAILASASASGHPAAELSIYGAGSLGPDLERWIAAGVSGWEIHLRPPTPHLRELMAEHDVLLMPSRFEGLGLLAVEALMAGLPVLGTRIAGLDEVLTSGYPLLAPSEDTRALGILLAQAISDPQSALESTRPWISRTAAKFGLARMAHEYDDFYQHLLQSGARLNRPQRLEPI